jgi:hypothetical protein
MAAHAGIVAVADRAGGLAGDGGRFAEDLVGGGYAVAEVMDSDQMSINHD